MPEIPRVGDLEVHQDLAHQRREWRFERAGWAVLVLFLLAALVGLLGHGPLSERTTGPPGGALRVTYPWVARHEAPARLRIDLDPGVRGEAVRLRIDRLFFELADVDRIDPQPRRVESAGDRYILEFEGGAGSEGPSALFIRFHPEGFGSVPVALGLEDGPEVDFRVFVVP